MGAWGSGFFENDDALDFVEEASAAGSVVPLLEALQLNPDEFIEAPDCSMALAAAELVALAAGRPDSETPAKIAARFAFLDPPDERLIAQAWVAADTVQIESELKTLWAATDQFARWNMKLDDLKQRLSEARG